MNHQNSKSIRPVLIFFTLSALLILSLFYRVSNAVIAPDLFQDLGLNAETLGILGGAYFYSFALLQIPMGPMLDRIGPRIVIASFSFMGALDAFLFAIGTSFTSALLGRILIGVGMSSVMMGSLKVFVLRFSPDRFATLMGILVSIGTLGNILAASPLAYLTSTIGWRMTFILAGGITALLAFLIFWILKGEEGAEDHRIPIQSRNRGPSFDAPDHGFPGLLADRCSLAFFRYGTLVSLQGLWLGPYLIDTQGYSPVQTGNLLIFLAIGIIVGGPIAGRLSDRVLRSRKGVALCGISPLCT